MIGACLLVLAQLDAARVSLARVEIRGPCAQLAVEIQGAGSIELTFPKALEAGEKRTISLAAPLPAVAMPRDVWSRALREALAATDHARLIELEPAAPLSGVDSELLARPRPVLAPRGARLPWSALFVLGASLAICLARRRKLWIVTLIAALSAASILLLLHGVRPEVISAVRILESRLGPAAGEPLLAVELRRESLELADLARARIEVVPPQRPVECRSQLEPPGFRLRSRGATFIRLASVDPGTRRLTRELNAFARFEATWLRESDGSWRSLGPWNLGDAMPEGLPGEPPGWLVPALPMGTSIFLGRLAEGEFSQAFEGEGGPPTWMRGLGL
ncbi:MAG: hypothetical protein ABIP42_00295 [Planctomycetota bacterium]